MKGKQRKTQKEKLLSSHRIVKRMMILSAAYLMEEQNWDDDSLVDYYEAMWRWSDAVEKHTITIQQVIDMINAKTGANIRW